jgi:L-lysine 2,3-aminomutase
MHTVDFAHTVEFKNSKETAVVDLGRLETHLTEFLELYGEVPLVDDEFRSIIGEGDGAARFSRLLAATRFENDPRGFLAELLDQLERAEVGRATDISVNGVRMPYHFLLAALEVVLPGDKIIKVQTVRRLERLTNIKVPEKDRAAMRRVLELYPVRFSTHVIRQMRLSRNVAYQFMPDLDELNPEGLAHTWVGQFHRGVLEQMYRNRVIFVLNMTCPVYCRFCFRKHKECRNQRSPSQKHVSEGLSYIRESPGIKEVVLTGGDPFMNRSTLTCAVDGLANIPHVETVRIATRSLSYHPALLTGKDSFWLDYLRRKQIELSQKGKKIEIATHFVHPDEVSRQTLEVTSDLVNSGIPVYVQTPYIGGCNDSGVELVELFRLLRAAGAEIHYVFMPCSPIQGNQRYKTPLSSGLMAARYVRAHLSDRAMPHFCTATAIGKIDWGCSGWAVEVDRDDERFIWLRTPYTSEYFESFAPILNLMNISRENSEGTLDAKFMAGIGDERFLMGPRETAGLTRAFLEREYFPEAEAAEALRQLQSEATRYQGGWMSMVSTGSPSLQRVHATRVELDCTAGDEELESDLVYIEEQEAVTDVVVYSPRDAVYSLYAIEPIVERLRRIRHVTAVRIRSWAANYEPHLFTEGVLRKLTSMNRLSVVNPTRLELETLFLHPSELGPEHGRIAKALGRRGVTMYCTVPLFAFINDGEEQVTGITAACRRFGIEVNHMYVAGLPLQREWSRTHPIHLSRIIDIASFLRRQGSGRELPRYLIQTQLGQVEIGITSQALSTDDEGNTRMTLLPYDLDYYRRMDPAFEFPRDTELDDEGHPIVTIPGLAM